MPPITGNFRVTVVAAHRFMRTLCCCNAVLHCPTYGKKTEVEALECTKKENHKENYC